MSPIPLSTTPSLVGTVDPVNGHSSIAGCGLDAFLPCWMAAVYRYDAEFEGDRLTGSLRIAFSSGQCRVMMDIAGALRDWLGSYHVPSGDAISAVALV